MLVFYRKLRDPLNNPNLVWSAVKQKFLSSYENPRKEFNLQEEVHHSLRVCQNFFMFNLITGISYQLRTAKTL